MYFTYKSESCHTKTRKIVRSEKKKSKKHALFFLSVISKHNKNIWKIYFYFLFFCNHRVAGLYIYTMMCGDVDGGGAGGGVRLRSERTNDDTLLWRPGAQQASCKWLVQVVREKHILPYNRHMCVCIFSIRIYVACLWWWWCIEIAQPKNNRIVYANAGLAYKMFILIIFMCVCVCLIRFFAYTLRNMHEI